MTAVSPPDSPATDSPALSLSRIGQIAIVVAACMVTAGSLLIQKIVDINV